MGGGGAGGGLFLPKTNSTAPQDFWDPRTAPRERHTALPSQDRQFAREQQCGAHQRTCAKPPTASDEEHFASCLPFARIQERSPEQGLRWTPLRESSRPFPAGMIRLLAGGCHLFRLPACNSLHFDEKPTTWPAWMFGDYLTSTAKPFHQEVQGRGLLPFNRTLSQIQTF